MQLEETENLVQSTYLIVKGLCSSLEANNVVRSLEDMFKMLLKYMCSEGNQ